MKIENKKILFYREGDIWYAAVDGHSKEENEMMNEANMFLSHLSKGDNIVVLSVSAYSKDEYAKLGFVRKIIFRKLSSDEYGAKYSCEHKQSTIWLCEVLKTVFGNYPDYLILEDIFHRSWRGPKYRYDSHSIFDYLEEELIQIYKEEIEGK